MKKVINNPQTAAPTVVPRLADNKYSPLAKSSATNYVFDHMEVGYALALFQLSTIVSIFLGYRIFKEENITKKLIGSVIMVAGSVMIILLK